MNKNIKKIFIYFICILFFTGCAFKQTILEINHYSIDFKFTSDSFEKSSKSIYVDKPDISKSFNTNSIFYTTKAYLFEDYAKNKWINLPSYMLHNNLVQSLEDSNIFKFVLQKRSQVDYDYTLKTKVANLYHSIEGNKSYAVLRVRFDLIRGKNFLKSYTYDKKVLCTTNNPYGFVVSLNKVLEEIVIDLTSQLNSEVKSKS